MSVRKKIQEWAWRQLGLADFIEESEWRRTLAIENEKVRKEVVELRIQMRALEFTMEESQENDRVHEKPRELHRTARVDLVEKKLGELSELVSKRVATSSDAHERQQEQLVEMNLTIEKMRAAKGSSKLLNEMRVEFSERLGSMDKFISKLRDDVTKLQGEQVSERLRSIKDSLKPKTPKKPRNVKAKAVK